MDDFIAWMDGDDGNVPGYAISYGCTLVFGNADDVLLILLVVSQWRVGADEKSLAFAGCVPADQTGQDWHGSTIFLVFFSSSSEFLTTRTGWGESIYTVVQQNCEPGTKKQLLTILPWLSGFCVSSSDGVLALSARILVTQLLCWSPRGTATRRQVLDRGWTGWCWGMRANW